MRTHHSTAFLTILVFFGGTSAIPSTEAGPTADPYCQSVFRIRTNDGHRGSCVLLSCKHLRTLLLERFSQPTTYFTRLLAFDILDSQDRLVAQHHTALCFADRSRELLLIQAPLLLPVNAFHPIALSDHDPPDRRRSVIGFPAKGSSKTSFT